MKELVAIQQRFAANLETPSNTESNQAALIAFAPDLIDDGRLTAEARVAIYRNNTEAARINALKQIYPVCLAILGERCFQGLARDHLYAYPSYNPDLNHYGQDFPQTLSQFLSGLDRSRRNDFDGMAYLPDLARFESLWHGLHYRADDPTFDAQAFASDAAANPDNIRLIPSHALCLFESSWPIHALWRAHRESGEASIAAGDGDRLALWRAGFEPHAEQVDNAMFELLSALLTGATLAALSNADQGTRLGECITRGWIVGHQAE